MKIRYILIIAFILTVLLASVPLSIGILTRQENEKLAMIAKQGRLNAQIIAFSALNILLLNGGDLRSSMVDIKDMLTGFGAMSSIEGIKYADAILVSSDKALNGIILARQFAPGVSTKSLPDRLTEREITERMKNPAFSEVHLPGVKDVCYEFTATASLRVKPPLCLGRIVYSRAAILDPVIRTRRFIYIAIAVTIIVVGMLGLIFSWRLLRPVEHLLAGVEQIGGGDLDYRVQVSSNNEFGILANTLNHLAQVVKLQINELMAANVELRRLDRLKDEFLANMSHELRTPLYGIIGIAESLIAGSAGVPTAEAAHDLRLIITSARRLAGMVNDILDFSKLKHRDIVLNRQPVDLGSLVQLVLDILRPAADKKALSLANEIPSGSLTVDADENRLQQIMLNLVGNAVKFTEAGSVRVSAARDAEDPTRIVVSVTDTGRGVPPDDAARIFESFEQGSLTASRSGGTGLGLAITKKLVELHGGRIWLESSPGGGSRFSFTITAADTAVEKKPEVFIDAFELRGLTLEEIRRASPASAEGTAGKTVLIVDDEPVNLQVILNLLILEGYDVVAATNGREALERIRTARPDLVILDVMLPEISGYEVCRAIRNEESLSDLPVLMLTARNRPGDVITGLEAGANDYVTKPVDRQELIARVRALISLATSAKLDRELAVIKRDIQIAHEIQKAILTRDIPSIQGVRIALRYEPMAELGGDFYDVQMISDNTLGVLLADVSGHGIPAALICAMLKVAYSFHRLETAEPAVLMKRICRTMYNYTGGQFITACYVCIDITGMKIRYANAGHWPLLIWRKTEQRIIADTENGLPIGWSAEEDYPLIERDLCPGDRIILYTDGVIEARDGANRMFGEEGLCGIVMRDSDRPVGEFIKELIHAVAEWTGRGDADIGFDDDITVIAIDIVDDAAEVM